MTMVLESGENYFGRFSSHFLTQIKRIYRIFLFFFRIIRVNSRQNQKRQSPVTDSRRGYSFSLRSFLASDCSGQVVTAMSDIAFLSMLGR